MGPLSCGELTLSALIQFTVGFADPQAIAEAQRPFRFRAPRREDMQVDIRVWPCQHAVLVPAGVPGHQPVALELQVGNVRGLLGRVGDNKEDVDDRLRREPGTDVDPTCSSRSTRFPSTERIRAASRSYSLGHSAS